MIFLVIILPLNVRSHDSRDISCIRSLEFFGELARGLEYM